MTIIYHKIRTHIPSAVGALKMFTADTNVLQPQRRHLAQLCFGLLGFFLLLASVFVPSLFPVFCGFFVVFFLSFEIVSTCPLFPAGSHLVISYLII